MVPLGAVEEFVGKVWPEAAHAVVAVPDEKRGEQVVLVTEFEPAARPRLPILGTGKIVYVTASQLAARPAPVTA
jgi:hypothetical protein